MAMLMGSKYFFGNFPDYIVHDIDTFEFVDTNDFKRFCLIHTRGKDMFFFKRKSKEEMIKDTLNSSNGMFIGSFLIPEFNQEIGFTIDDLPRLKSLIDKLDEKHQYEEIIYNFYIENKAFTLTEEQRLIAYNVYKQVRGY